MRDQIHALLTDRRSPEARAFLLMVLRYVEHRVGVLRGRRYGDLLGPVDAEEIVAEVGMKLVNGALARFRGNDLPELLAYVRTITDRCTGRLARRHLREHRASQDLLDTSAAHAGSLPRPDAEIEVLCPFTERDQAYLLALLEAGSRAEYARLQGQSRAAVTRMVQRIRDRIEALSADQRMAAQVWLEQQAREIVSRRSELAEAG
ncbi:MAG: hypothetical protein JXB39_00085 [Deltaproteobacteria bacterium]|nr:hypothetical protein [Deltaproteobacteria bacterium]